MIKATITHIGKPVQVFDRFWTYKMWNVPITYDGEEHLVNGFWFRQWQPSVGDTYVRDGYLAWVKRGYQSGDNPLPFSKEKLSIGLALAGIDLPASVVIKNANGSSVFYVDPHVFPEDL